MKTFAHYGAIFHASKLKVDDEESPFIICPAYEFRFDQFSNGMDWAWKDLAYRERFVIVNQVIVS